jgi:rfaE bifunctional protein nucleotidyltransferase chain/domain
MAKVIERPEDLAGIVRGLQSQGKIVVFTNGVFDLLHVGHVRSLRDARSRGDFLVVGVNTDESVEQFKGPGLPLNPLAERIEVLEAVSLIDYITTISDPTADNVLRILRPDLHAKGTDYTEETVPERATVIGYGGRVVIVGDPKTHSTTGLIRRIQSMAPRGSGGASGAVALQPKPEKPAKAAAGRGVAPARASARNVYTGRAKVRVKVASPAKKAPGARAGNKRARSRKVAKVAARRR